MKSLIRKIRKKLSEPISNRKGIALITAIAAMTLMTYLAMEVMYDTQVEYVIHSQDINRIKAYYAARSGLEISLLRLKMYQTIVNKLGKNLPTDGMVDQIWQFPFMWPLELPEGMNDVDTSQIKAAVKESKMDATFITKITDEGSRIDINDLNSPSKTLREITKKQILNIFENKIKTDQSFAKRHAGAGFEELVNNIADWMSDKNTSLNGGDKRTYYRQVSGSEDFPPNRALRTLPELHLIKGMNDEFYDLLEPNITIYGLKGINPNTASKEVLKAIDPAITDQIAADIQKRISTPAEGGPFKDAKSFWDFLAQKNVGITVKQEDVPIVTTGLFSFRISSIGVFGSSKREIEVVVLDINQAASRLSELVQADAKKDHPETEEERKKREDAEKAKKPQATGPGSQTATNPLPKGPPRIVYWTEK